MIRVRSCPSCFVCGAAGELAYKGLEDVLYGAEGKWSFRRCSNADCGLLWLDPQPLEADIGQAYIQYFTHDAASTRAGAARRIYGQVRASYLRSALGYADGAGGGATRWLAPLAHLHPGGADVFAAWAMFLPSPPDGGALLDVGCGGGDFMARMQERGWIVSGVETDPVAVERARSRGLEVHQGDLSVGALDDSAFDAITLSHVIEHVHDPRALLARCRQLLKPKGTLVILTPNSGSWGNQHFGSDWLNLDPPRHIHVFNTRNIRRLFLSASLTPTRIATLAINASAVWPSSAAIRVQRSAPAAARHAVGVRTTKAGIARQAAERLLLGVEPDAGEDLLVIAKRPD